MKIDYYYLNYNSYYRINISDEIILVKNPFAVFYVNKANNNISEIDNKINILKSIELVTKNSSLVDFFHKESFYDEQMINIKDFSIDNGNILISTINNLETKVIYKNIKKYLLKIKKKHLFFSFDLTTNELIIYIYYNDFNYKLECKNILSYYLANESFRNELWNPRNTNSKRTKYKIDNISKVDDSLFMKYIIDSFFIKSNLRENYSEFLISDNFGEEIISVICSPDIQISKLSY